VSSSPDANYYAYPLDVCAEVSEALRVTKIYRLPTNLKESIHNEPHPFDRRRVHPVSLSEYHPDLRPQPRTTLKPLHILQPEGPSFDIHGNRVSWEKWSFRVGFNYREGMTLHDIRYDSRSLFYRLSLAEMFVPYGDPRAPYQRKAAFDLGNDGAGINANNLQLGCDCLGKPTSWSALTKLITGRNDQVLRCLPQHSRGRATAIAKRDLLPRAR
jgi:primary-amine oxidase